MSADGGSTRRGGSWRLMAAYLAVSITLTCITAVLPGPPAGAIRLLVVLVGLAVFILGVARRRPQPMIAWWFLVAAAVAEVAAALSVADLYGLGSRSGFRAVLPVILASIVLPLFAIGLGFLSRDSPYGGIADGLDATTTALAGFLLVWTFLVEPKLDTEQFNVTAGAAYTAGTLAVFAVAAKLALGGAWTDPAVRLLLLAMVVLLATSILELLPALSSTAIPTNLTGGLLFGFYGALLGAVGLHPGLTAPRGRHGRTTLSLSTPRIALYAVLALIAPATWGVELTRDGEDITHHAAGFWVPVVVSGVFLFLLVIRLELIARVAQHRASDLAGRSAALSSAVSEQQALQQQLAYRAMHDPLTGLSNRTVLAERLDELFKQPGRYGRPAVLLFDLDGFKDVNDTLGHPTGDELLVEVARQLRRAAPAEATLARLGGDEFVVLLEEADLAQAQRWADTLRAAVNRSYEIAGRELFVTTSVGLLTTDPDRPRPTPAEMLRDADLALYAAKEAGKNRTMVFDPEFRHARMHRTRMASALRRALDNDEFLLHYQPIVELETRRIWSVEALIRWQPPRSALTPPSEFIPVAEGSGLIVPLGAWILRTACTAARSWHLEYGISVSVNVSGRQLDEPDFADAVLATLADTDLPGTALIIEITESTLVTASHTDLLNEHLRRLREAGIRIAIDDFGTGYSSLSYVASLPIDVVKIDKAFTQAPAGPGLPPEDWAFTKAILELVASLDMTAIAEGVESHEQAEALRFLRCPMVQGFLFARPVPAEAIDRTLEGLGPRLLRLSGGHPAAPPAAS